MTVVGHVLTLVSREESLCNSGLSRVKALRERTGAGVMDCRKALEESQGDLEKAEGLLSQWGMLKAEKRSGAETLEGMVEAYIHSGSRIGALVEVNCQTDFVARTPDFKELAHNLAMQVAAMAPEFGLTALSCQRTTAGIQRKYACFSSPSSRTALRSSRI